MSQRRRNLPSADYSDIRHLPETPSETESSTAQDLVDRLGFFMLRLGYVMFPTMKPVLTATTGALYRKARPTAISQLQVGGRRL
jgi:hypothetical protein